MEGLNEARLGWGMAGLGEARLGNGLGGMAGLDVELEILEGSTG